MTLLIITSTLQVCDFIIMGVYSALVMLCLCGEHKVGVIMFFNINMLQLLPVALPLELGVFQKVKYTYDFIVRTLDNIIW